MKTLLLWRPAGIGDALWLTAPLPLLARAGWTIDVGVNGKVAPVFANNPHVRAVLILEGQTDERGKRYFPDETLYVADPFAAARWTDSLASRYNRITSLAGLLETRFLWRFKDRPLEYSLPLADRQTEANFTDEVTALAGLPGVRGLLPQLYPSREERDWLRRMRRAGRGRRIVLWHLAGSAFHKMHPDAPAWIAGLFHRDESIAVYLVGDDTGWNTWARDRMPARAWAACRPVAGMWTLREMLLAPRFADLVVGPESALVNAAAGLPVPKVVFFSHTRPVNLSRWWWNTYPVLPTCACAPCYQSHDGVTPTCMVDVVDWRKGAKCCSNFREDIPALLHTILNGDPARTCPACGMRRENRAAAGGGWACKCGVTFGAPADAAPLPAVSLARPPLGGPARAYDTPWTAEPTPFEPIPRAEILDMVDGVQTRGLTVAGLLYVRPVRPGEGAAFGALSPLPAAVLEKLLRETAETVRNTQEKGGDLDG